MDYEFDAKNEKMKYNLDEYSCYKKLTGICSLDIEKAIDITEIKSECMETYNKIFEHCRNLKDYMESIKESPITKKSWGRVNFLFLLQKTKMGNVLQAMGSTESVYHKKREYF